MIIKTEYLKKLKYLQLVKTQSMRSERQMKKHITKYNEEDLAQKTSPSSYRLPDTDFILHSKLPSNKNSHFTIHSKKQRKDNQTKFMMLK